MISMTFTGFGFDAFAALQRGHQFGGRRYLAITRIAVRNVAAARDRCRRESFDVVVETLPDSSAGSAGAAPRD